MHMMLLLTLQKVTKKRIYHRSPQNSRPDTCSVHIAADHAFFKHVGKGSESTAIEEMVYNMGVADKTFTATDFNQDGGEGDGIGFFIAAVTVYTDITAEGTALFHFFNLINLLLSIGSMGSFSKVTVLEKHVINTPNIVKGLKLKIWRGHCCMEEYTDIMRFLTHYVHVIKSLPDTKHGQNSK